jgi:hypothetical protein
MINPNLWSPTLKNVFALLATCSLTMAAHAGCYSVYNPAGNLIFQSSEAPVDTRLEYHSTVPQRFGQGATLVYINDEQSCTQVGTLVGMSDATTGRATGRVGQGQGTQIRPGRADRG